MARPDPEMRASQMHANLASLDVLGDAAEEVRRTCAHVIAPIQQALRVSWLPLQLNVELVQCVEDLCGQAGLRDLICASIAHSMRGTLFRPIVDGLSRLGMGPQHGLKRCKQGWMLTYRNCGAIACTLAEAGEARLVLHDGPALMYGDAYLRSILFAFEGVAIQLGGREVEAEILHRRNAEFSLRWAA